MLAYVGQSWAYLGPMFAYLGPMLALCWPILGLCWPFVRLCWAYVGDMLAMRFGHLDVQNLELLQVFVEKLA